MTEKKTGSRVKTKQNAIKDKSKSVKRGRGRGDVGKDAIVQSTRALLREVSPASITRKSVADAAGVDPALVRYYFSDVRHLLTEVLKILVDDYYTRVAALNIDTAKPREAFAKRALHLVTFLSEEPSFHELFVEQIVNGNDEWAKVTRDNFTDTFFGGMREIVENGRVVGMFRENFDSRFVYLSLIGAAHFLGSSGPIFARLFGDQEKPIEFSEEYAKFLADIFLRGMERGDFKN